MDKLEKLNKILNHSFDIKNKYKDFLKWFNSIENPTKKLVLEQYQTIVNAQDWTNYALKECKKEQLKDKILYVCNRRLNEIQVNIDNTSAELEKINIFQKQIEDKNKIAELIHKILDEKLRTLEYHYPNRQLECLRVLIDDGTITTESELNEYI